MGRVIIKQEFLYFTWYRGGSLNNEIISYNLERGVQRIQIEGITMNKWYSCKFKE